MAVELSCQPHLKLQGWNRIVKWAEGRSQAALLPGQRPTCRPHPSPHMGGLAALPPCLQLETELWKTTAPWAPCDPAAAGDGRTPDLDWASGKFNFHELMSPRVLAHRGRWEGRGGSVGAPSPSATWAAPRSVFIYGASRWDVVCLKKGLCHLELASPVWGGAAWSTRPWGGGWSSGPVNSAQRNWTYAGPCRRRWRCESWAPALISRSSRAAGRQEGLPDMKWEEPAGVTGQGRAWGARTGADLWRRGLSHEQGATGRGMTVQGRMVGSWPKDQVLQAGGPGHKVGLASVISSRTSQVFLPLAHLETTVWGSGINQRMWEHLYGQGERKLTPFSLYYEAWKKRRTSNIRRSLNAHFEQHFQQKSLPTLNENFSAFSQISLLCIGLHK